MSDHESPWYLLTPMDILQTSVQGPVWSLSTEQLNINVLRFESGEGVALHVNSELDVFGIVLEGQGRLTIENEDHVLTAGQVFIIPRGTPRAISATSATFAYASCHCRRPGLMPQFSA